MRLTRSQLDALTNKGLFEIDTYGKYAIGEHFVVLKSTHSSEKFTGLLVESTFETGGIYEIVYSNNKKL